MADLREASLGPLCQKFGKGRMEGKVSTMDVEGQISPPRVVEGQISLPRVVEGQVSTKAVERNDSTKGVEEGVGVLRIAEEVSAVEVDVEEKLLQKNWTLCLTTIWERMPEKLA